LLLGLSVSSCSLFSADLQPDPEYQLNPQEQALAQIQHWSLGARLSVRYENTAWSGGLRWRQSPQDFVLSVSAPLGQGALRLQGDINAVRFQSADGRELLADDLAHMIRHELGFELPVLELRNWIRGLPATPGGAFLVRDDQQRIQVIRQRGWRVDYAAYQEFSAQWLPRKIHISDGSYDIRIAVYDWQDETTAAAAEHVNHE